MKNKIVLFGSLCLVLALGLVFVGCNNVQQVEFTFQGSPENVTKSYSAPTVTYVVTGGTGWTYANGELTVNWDAVDGAGGYYVVLGQDDKWSRIETGGSGYIISTAGNIDKWEAKIATHTLTYNTNYDVSPAKTTYSWDPKWPGTFKIGVVAESRRVDVNDSEPTWAEGTFTFSSVSYTYP